MDHRFPYTVNRKPQFWPIPSTHLFTFQARLQQEPHVPLLPPRPLFRSHQESLESEGHSVLDVSTRKKNNSINEKYIYFKKYKHNYNWICLCIFTFFCGKTVCTTMWYHIRFDSWKIEEHIIKQNKHILYNIYIYPWYANSLT